MKLEIGILGSILIGLAGVASTAAAQGHSKATKQQYCQSVAALRQSLERAKDLEPKSKMSAARGEFKNIQRAAQDVRQSEQALTAQGNKRVAEAEAKLRASLKTVPDEATLEQARRIIQPELDALNKAQQELTDSLDCGE